MIRHTLKKHKYKVAFGVPIMFLLASSLTLVRDTEELCIIPENNRFVEVGEKVTLHVIAEADTPVNVISGTITVPTDFISIDNVQKEDSIIDLWTQEPIIDNTGTVLFSGGVVQPAGFTGKGNVLTLTIHPIKDGKATITFKDAHMLAHDGTGMEVSCENAPITLSIRPETFPHPDVNGDTSVDVLDFGIVSARIFMNYERPYDLNLDGLITFSDLAILFSELTGNGKLGSLAISWVN